MAVIESVIENSVVSTTEAARQARISYRQIDWWARQEIFVPSRVESTGSTQRRSYSIGEVQTLRVLGELSRLGTPLNTLSRVGEQIRSTLEEEVDEQHRWLIVCPDGECRICSSTMMAEVLRTAGSVSVLIVDLVKILNTPPLSQTG